MTDLDRRSFIKTGTGVAVGTAVAGGPFAGFLAGPAVAGAGRDGQNVLRPVLDQRDLVARLQLPEGFQYRSFHESRRGGTGPNVELDDGALLPGRHDGMAAFSGPGSLITLVRNHEENFSATNGAAAGADTPVYDSAALGGTSNVHVTLDGVVEHAFMSLGGTQMNCSGGRMPWGSWVTCEETINGYDVGDDFNRGTAPPTTYIQNARLQQRHGYIYEVPADGAASAAPIRQAGRFAHEAVAFDPRGGSLYLTEDNFAFPSGFYRYDPPSNPLRSGRLEDGGTLSMLRVKGQPGAELSAHFANGTSFDIEWVPIANPDVDFGQPVAGVPNATNDEALMFVSNQGLAQGAARFSRLEGAVYDHGWVFWSSTQGGASPPG
ncbi:MAG: alkaline phosphatase PhoX, partial [Actinomycetes bacterium]